MLTTENSTELAPMTGPTTPYFYEFLDETRRKIAQIAMDYVIIFSVFVLGVVTNILVILVYAKQGFKESVAVSMTTIAIWDLIKCLAGILNNFSGILSIWDPIAAYSWINISTPVFNYLVCFSSYVTSVMAAYVAIERCLCVTIPLKVKWLLTPKVTLIACLVMSIVVFGAFACMFGVYDIEWVWSETFNRTVASYKKSKFYLQNEDPVFLYYSISGVVWPLASFVVILVATIIIIVKLRQSSKFRFGNQTSVASKKDRSSSEMEMQEVSSSQSKTQGNLNAQQQNSMRRDRQVVKMLLVIIIIYIACLAPRIAHYLAKFFVYELYWLRRYNHLFEFVLYWLMLADAVNGAVNFFVFYFMSTSFRATFQAVFKRSLSSKKPSLAPRPSTK